MTADAVSTAERSTPHRILFASDTSGHSIGYHVVARAFREAGFEVIMVGRQLPDDAVRAAVDEDADLIAFRTMDRDPIAVGTALLAAMRAEHVADRPLLMGGIINQPDVDALHQAGVSGVFGPGSRLEDIVHRAREAIARAAQSS